MTTLLGLTIVACTIFGVLMVAFVLALAKKDNGLIDVFYGLTFSLAAFVLYFSINNVTLPSVVLLSLVTIWGIRLSLRIYFKHKGKGEDFRYHAWRMLWSKRGRGYFIGRSFLQIYLLQGSVIFFVLLPVALVMLYANPDAGVSVVGILGLLLWIVGFGIESVADYQIDSFAKNKRKRKDALLTKGLFAYSRRPNYFGEALMWWGIWILSLGVLGVALGSIALLSPLLITYIVTCVTGPMLEEKWSKTKAFETYRKKTSYFIPLPRHK